jgi:hypothetical protein
MASIGVGIAVLVSVHLWRLGSPTTRFDPPSVAIVASGVAFTLVFLLRRAKGGRGLER